MTSTNSRWATVFCLAASTLLPSSAFVTPVAKAAEMPATAAPTTPPAAPAEPQHRHRRRHNPFGRLHDDLKLSTSQESLWQQALDTRKQGMMKLRDERRQMRKTLIQKLAEPQVDLKALASETDAAQAQQTQLRKAMRDQWLAFYDSLDAGQRGQVRQFLLDRLQQPQRWHRGFRHERHSDGR